MVIHSEVAPLPTGLAITQRNPVEGLGKGVSPMNKKKKKTNQNQADKKSDSSHLIKQSKGSPNKDVLLTILKKRL